MTFHAPRWWLAPLAFSLAAPVFAQDMPSMHDGMQGMEGMSGMDEMHHDTPSQAADATEASSVAAPDRYAMHTMATPPAAMRGALGPYPMDRESSGTSWQPDSTPTAGHMTMGETWQTMLHGSLTAVHTDIEGPRGGRDGFVESMAMGMAQRRMGNGVLALRGMVSLDPWLVGNDGYRLLLQSGESADGVTPLVDRQHPHDLWMELSASYAWNTGPASSVFVYAGLPGEPALGPPAYMHRASGMDSPDAPLGHHWLDATHITFGVTTLGWTWRAWKLEGSAFNGREPDQHRTDIETGPLDSWSARVSWNPDPHWSLQLSHGALKSPERLDPGVDVDRTTASVMHQQATQAGTWATTFAWGRNRKHPGITTDAWLLESALAQQNGWTWYGRAERVDKDELFGEDDPLHGIPFAIDKLSLGAVHEWPMAAGRFGLGAQLSRHWLPAALVPAYGHTPGAWLVFARWRL